MEKKTDSTKKLDDAKKKELVKKTLADRMKKNAEALRKLSKH
ncbi:hypothetical protein [Peribacillus faecalis]|nr:hypothetical protein [Peribacillus faecalis]